MMGKVISRTYVTRDDQLIQLKAGPISLVMGRNLRKLPGKSPVAVSPESPKPSLTNHARGG